MNMRKARVFGWSGYTIIEVMIVLAISGTILAAALIFFRGQQGETSFDVSVHDADSELTTRLKEVSTALSYFPDQYSCRFDNATKKIVITADPPANQGTNRDCIVLGKAFWPHKDSSDIDIYTVIGSRLEDGTGSITTNLDHALPTVNGDLLKQTYTIGAATILSSQVLSNSGDTGTTYLVGYYSNLSGSSGVANLQSLSYDFESTNYDNLKTCIEQTNIAACPQPESISSWTLCLGSVYGPKTAKLEISNTSEGISTNIKFEDCN